MNDLVKPDEITPKSAQVMKQRIQNPDSSSNKIFQSSQIGTPFSGNLINKEVLQQQDYLMMLKPHKENYSSSS